ncbi:MAG: SH3 domain-containing protein [Thermomicrobiales bacterium]|nr:SH3 domain-containing protein [Thermomicrobiales bacterium]MCO5221934.1 SH3 domain-containing protein [Thermomicrobiales bacterium]
MLRRFACVLVAACLLLAPALPIFTSQAFAQDASPVAAEPDLPIEDPTTASEPSGLDAQGAEPLDAPESEPVDAADDGNTPADEWSMVTVFPLPDVYVTFYRVTIAGQTDAWDTTPGSLPAGYRADNARAVDIATTASFTGQVIVCVLYQSSAFADPAAVALFRHDGAGWIDITDPGQSQPGSATVCGYAPALGSFAVAEPGQAPTETATIPPPTETQVPSTTPSSTATATDSPTAPATSTATPSPTVTSSPTSTGTPTVSPPPSDTATPSPSATPTTTPSTTPADTTTATPLPTWTPTTTPSNTPVDTATSIPSLTSTPTFSPSTTPSETSTSSSTPSPTGTTTSGGPIQFALPLSNVYVTYGTTPAAGTTTGAVLNGNQVPAVPADYLGANAWFVAVESTVQQTGNKQLCVVFEANRFANPGTVVLLRQNGGSWIPLSGQQILDLTSIQGTACGYTALFGNFALVERAPATAVPTATGTRTATPTMTSTATWAPSATSSPSSTATATTTQTASTTPTSTPSPTSSVTPSSTATATVTVTATLAPGSYHPGAMLQARVGVHLRAGASTSTVSLGVVSKGTHVTVTGASVAAEGRIWVPVSVAGMGTGWIAGSYLNPVPTVTPTRTAGPSTPTRTPTRPPGGFIAGDAVEVTTSLNLRAGPSTSFAVLAVLPKKAAGTITGPGVSSGGRVFYPIQVAGYPVGYVASSYLKQISAVPTASRTPTPSPTVAGVPIRYTTHNVNLRSGPGTNYRSIAVLSKDTRVTIIGVSKRSGGYDWYPVLVADVGQGWIAGKYLTMLGPV